MIDFTNNNINLDHIPKYEDIPLTPPNRNYWKVIVLNIITLLILLAGFLTAFVLLDEEIRDHYAYFIVGFLFFSVLIFVFYSASFKKRGFALREKDIIYKHGIIAETTTIIPLNRIQHVALDEGIFSRMYKLGKLQVFTAGGHSGHLNIAGIEIEKAKSMRELLLRKLDQIEQQAEKE